MVSFPPNVFLFTGHFFPENVFRPSTDPPLKATGLRDPSPRRQRIFFFFLLVLVETMA